MKFEALPKELIFKIIGHCDASTKIFHIYSIRKLAISYGLGRTWVDLAYHPTNQKKFEMELELWGPRGKEEERRGTKTIRIVC